MNPTQQQLGRWQHRLNDRLNDAGKYKSQDKRFLLKCGDGTIVANTLTKKRREHQARHPNDLQAKHGVKQQASEPEYDTVIIEHDICLADGKDEPLIAKGNSAQEAWSQIDPHQYCFAGSRGVYVYYSNNKKIVTYTSMVSKWISFERRENQLEYGDITESNEAKVMYCEAKFQAKTVAELKEVCRSHQLPVSGTKGKLIVRLVTFFGNNPQHGTEFEVDGGEEE